MKLAMIPPRLAGKIVKKKNACCRNQSDYRIFRIPPARKLRKDNKFCYLALSHQDVGGPCLKEEVSKLYLNPTKKNRQPYKSDNTFNLNTEAVVGSLF